MFMYANTRVTFAVPIQVGTMSAAAPWRNALLKSLDLNKELKYSTFFQLATVKPNGKPANRTMVYRGFVGESTKLTFTTDSRCAVKLLPMHGSVLQLVHAAAVTSRAAAHPGLLMCAEAQRWMM